jgi:monofunctional glycosyltransferase
MSVLSLPRRLLRLFCWVILAAAVLSAGSVLLLRWVDPPTSAFMLRERLAVSRSAPQPYDIRHRWVDATGISPHVKVAVIAAEDQNFPAHHGFDLKSINDALVDRQRGRRVRGASTISQQVAKNLFLWPGRSYVRKALEFPLALWIDLVMPKRRIMEIYLNVAEWGPNGEFGAQAGARAAFGKNARDLSPREAALLASVLPNPKRRSARQPGAPVQRLAGIYAARAARSPHVGACVRPPARAAKT